MIALYKKGDTHKVRGIECTVARFEIIEMEDKLKEGWLKSPEELIKPAKQKKKSANPKKVEQDDNKD